MPKPQSIFPLTLINYFTHQLSENPTVNQGVVGSSPSWSALKIKELREIATPFSFPPEQILVINSAVLKFHAI